MEYLMRGIARAGGIEVPAEARFFPKQETTAPRRRSGQRLTRVTARLLRGLGAQLTRIADTLLRQDQAFVVERCRP